MDYEDFEDAAVDGVRIRLDAVLEQPIKDGQVAVVEMDFTGVDDYEPVLAEVHRVLKAEGRVVMHPPMVPAGFTQGWSLVHADSEYAVLEKLADSVASGTIYTRKMDKKMIEYREAWAHELEVGQHCGKCQFFQNEDECDLVSGTIEADDYCMVFRPTGAVSKADGYEIDSQVWGIDGCAPDALSKASADRNRFTFTVVYKATNHESSPETDAHNEYATAEELRDATWKHVKSGDRSIFIQHGQSVFGFRKAGEWVELVTWPQEATFDFHNADGTLIKRTIPANSIYMGVQWNEWAWPLVKAGKIRGLSFGGRAKRIPV